MPDTITATEDGTLDHPALPDEPVNREFRLDEVELRDGPDGKIEFVGHAAVWDRRSEDLGGFVEVIQRGAFRKVLDTAPDVRFLVNHQGMPLARTKSGTMELREDPKGLRVYADLAPIGLSRDVRTLVKRGDMDQMSFAFRVGKDVWTEDPETGGLLRTIISFKELHDVSVVTYPAYPQTDATVRSLLGEQIRTADGDLDGEAVRALAWRVHRGELDATDAERGTLDAALQELGTVSPWMAQRAALAFAQEQELRGVIPGRVVTVTVEDAPQGQPDQFRLAARQRRLRQRAA